MSNKILIIGPAWVGDMVMAQVLFQLLHQSRKTCELHVLAPACTHALLSRMPEVSRAIALPFTHGQLQLKKRYQFAKQLQAEKYDQAIVLPNSWKSALIPYWARIPTRTGWVGEWRYGLLNDARRLMPKDFPTMAQRFAALVFPRNMQLAANLPVPKLSVFRETTHHSTQPIIALCPGAEFGASKRWPAEYFAEIANQKLSEGWAVWIFGSSNDCAIAEEIQTYTQHRCKNLTGKTTLSEAIDLLAQAHTVITNDSGLMHIAAAVGCRVIVLYGSTSPDFTPPLTDKATILKTNLPCQPCFKRECPLRHHECMRSLLPASINFT